MSDYSEALTPPELQDLLERGSKFQQWANENGFGPNTTEDKLLTALGRIDEVWERLDRLPASLIYYPDALKLIGPWRDEIQEILRPNFKVNKEK